MNKLKPIPFYKTNEPYGCFANFSRHGINLDGEFCPTTEHYFQAKKFVGTEHENIVRSAKTPGDAARLGRDRERPLRADWEDVKDDVMRRAVRAKFEQHEDIREILLGTGDAELIENATGDYYWGIGTRGDGKNMLGIILMEVREELREEGEGWGEGKSPNTKMQLKILTGDLLDQPAEAIVNPWNRNFIPPWLLWPHGVSCAIKNARVGSRFNNCTNSALYNPVRP